MLVLFSACALLALVPVLATSGAHALRRGLFTGARDPDRNRAVGTALTICSLGAVLLSIADISVRLPDASASTIGFLRIGVVVTWIGGFAFGWRRRFSAATERWLYTTARPHWRSLGGCSEITSRVGPTRCACSAWGYG